MKRMIVFFLFVCLGGSTFAWEPKNIKGTFEVLSWAEQELSPRQQKILENGKITFRNTASEIKKIKIENNEKALLDVATHLETIINYYNEAKQTDKRTGQLLGVWLAMQPLASEDEPFLGPLDNVYMGISHTLSKYSVSQETLFTIFALDIRNDLVLFRELN